MRIWTLVAGCATPSVLLLDQDVDSHRVSGSHACLVNVTPISILRCTVAFKTYHAMKMDYRGTIDKAVLEKDFGPVWERTIELINHFCKELRIV